MTMKFGNFANFIVGKFLLSFGRLLSKYGVAREKLKTEKDAAKIDICSPICLPKFSVNFPCALLCSY